MDISLKDRILYLASTDSMGVFPQNTPGNFTVQLPKTLSLPGQWVCALTEIVYEPKFIGKRPSNLYICSDIVQPSYESDALLPVLRKISVLDSFNMKSINIFPQNYYVEVNQDEIQYFTVYIKDQSLEPVSFESQTLTCTVHLKQLQDG